MSKKLADKHILLAVSGSIAAYKAPDMIRRLQEEGAQVEVILTQGGAQFITKLTLDSVSVRPVRDNRWSDGGERQKTMLHIDLARWADVLLLAPASAELIANLAQGRAHHLLAAIALAMQDKLVIAPAMNVQMWQSAAVQSHIKTLIERGARIIQPDSGEQACGEIGTGRLPAVSDILQALSQQFQSQALLGKRVLITAGATVEDIDPVRFLSNRSSGKMAYFLAQSCIEAGAQVTFIYASIKVGLPERVHAIPVRSARQMHEQVIAQLDQHDVLISAAAITDYRVKQYAQQKIKRTEQTMILELIHNADILSDAAKRNANVLCVGFAAESENVVENAREKLKRKGIAMIVANDISGCEMGFEADDNAVDIITQTNQVHLGKQSKKNIAKKIIKEVIRALSLRKK